MWDVLEAHWNLISPNFIFVPKKEGGGGGGGNLCLETVMCKWNYYIWVGIKAIEAEIKTF